MVKTTGLGQGVNLLFGDNVDEEKFFDCDIDKIVANKHQPRQHFDEKELQNLTDSIKQNGVIQPLIINNQNGDGTYELIAGERRLRASKLAGLSSVPVVLFEVEDEDSLLELALIENLQRQDLNPIEEAEAYQKLIEKFGYTQEQTAVRVGKSRTTVTNILRLLNLPQFIKDDLVQAIISEGHARVLLRLGEDLVTIEKVRDEIVKKKLSVRQTERFVKNLGHKPKTIKSSVPDEREYEMPKAYSAALANQVTNKLNSKVLIRQNGSRGKIEIEYYSFDDLERLVAVIVGE